MGATATMVVPQHLQQLARAQNIRMKIAETREKTKQAPSRAESMAVLADALENVPELGSARVTHLLRGCFRIGPGEAERIMRRIDSSSGRRVRDLSRRQYASLLAYLRGDE